MCLYISITSIGTEIESRFNKKFVPEDLSLFNGIYFTSAFNKPKVPVITSVDDNIRLFEWGLIPFWAKDIKVANDIQSKTYNAKSETIFEKPSYKASIINRRCLIIADGFFEWKEVKGKKYPFYIKLKDQKIFPIAGIWDIWQGKHTFSIITTKANPLMAEIHNVKKRMPVILKKEDEAKWLSDISPDEIESFFSGYDDKSMEAYSVSKLLTARGTKNNDPKVIEPFEYEELKKHAR